MSQYNKELSLASELVKKASDITEWFKKKGFNSFEKVDKSPVTLADFASQIYIISKLRENFPEDQLFAEESTNNIYQKSKQIINDCYIDLNLSEIDNYQLNLNYRGPRSKRQWVIDPIDGTKGYVENLLYSIGIGFMVDSEPMVSAIAAPNYNKEGLAIFIAEKDQGAKVSYGSKDYITINVGHQRVLKKARICHSLHNVSQSTLKFAKMMKIKDKNRFKLDGMIKFCTIADGTNDFFLHLNGSITHSWDYCPGDLLVREAKGKVTDIGGKRLKFKETRCIITKPGIIAANDILHSEILGYYNKKLNE